MGRHINPVIFKNLKAFLGVFFKEVNFWPLILDISWVSGGMIALFWRKMLFFGSFVLFSVGSISDAFGMHFGKFRKHFGCISDAFRKFRSRDMNAAMWYAPRTLPVHLMKTGYNLLVSSRVLSEVFNCSNWLSAASSISPWLGFACSETVEELLPVIRGSCSIADMGIPSGLIPVRKRKSVGWMFVCQV